MDKKPGIRPRPGIRHMLDVASRYAFPGAQTVILLILLSAPIGLPLQPQGQSAWAMANVFFWSLFRPGSMPAALVFSIGLLLDLLTQEPLGVQVLLLLLIHGLALKLRRDLARSGFATVWFIFALTASGAALLELVLVMVFSWHLLPPGAALFEAALATGLYPLIAWYLTWLHRGLAAPERAA